MTDRVSDRVNRLRPFVVMDVQARAKALEAQGRDIVYLEIGDRTPGGGVIYSDDDDIHKLAPADISVIRVADLPLPPTSGQAVLPWGDG